MCFRIAFSKVFGMHKCFCLCRKPSINASEQNVVEKAFKENDKPPAPTKKEREETKKVLNVLNNFVIKRTRSILPLQNYSLNITNFGEEKELVSFSTKDISLEVSAV